MALPWAARRRILKLLLNYDLHPSCRVGLCLVLSKRLVMGAHSRIGALTVCKGLDLLELGENAAIGRLNWITGYPSDGRKFFTAVPNRQPILVLQDHAAITNRHIIDCTASVTLGRFSMVAGYRSQILTHSIDLVRSCQDARPIAIGAYCFVGTNCVIVGGSALPDYSVLSASSLLNRQMTEGFWLYGGVPARQLKRLPKELAYFNRDSGVVS
jgi:acetyltransferase-like isoleucine patch superfamily enzyme